MARLLRRRGRRRGRAGRLLPSLRRAGTRFAACAPSPAAVLTAVRTCVRGTEGVAARVLPARCRTRQRGRCDRGRRQLPQQVGLADALALCVLLAEKEPERFNRAAVRWHGRYALELSGVTLAESQLVLASLASLATSRPEAGRQALAELAAARRLHGFESALRRFAV
jgi:hypothetical protein